MNNFNDISKNNGDLTLDQVSMQYGISTNRNQLIPGRFYSFKTISPTPSLDQETIKLITGKNYYDLNPVGFLFFHDNWKETALILNLKVIPPRANLKILESFWKFSQSNGLNNLFDANGKLLPLSQRSLIDQRFYLVTPKVLSNVLGVKNLNYSINKYNMDQIVEAKMIDWDNFGMLINPKLTLNGFYPDPIDLAKVWEDFLTNTLI